MFELSGWEKASKMLGQGGKSVRVKQDSSVAQVAKNVIRHLSPHLSAQATSRFLRQMNQKFTSALAKADSE